MPELTLARAAVYRRSVRAGEARVWENVRDWEHLPWLHRTSFRSIECLEEGDSGWRARVGLHPSAEILLELAIDAGASRYVSRTLEGPGAGTEIWTAVRAVAPDRTDVEVEFWLPERDPSRREALGAAYTRLYRQLWDEDEAMMVRRAALLGAEAPGEPGALALGPGDALRARLPLCVEWGGRPWRIVELGGALVVHATVCPHALGPLAEVPVNAAGVLRCPWHGYRFDVRSGRSADGHRLRLPRAPALAIGPDGELRLGAPRPAISSAPAAR